MKEILPLSSLRFFAALLVVIEHLQMFRGLEGIYVLWGHELGAMGVSVFFVLSGYILSYTYLDRDWEGAFRANARDFFVGRIGRVIPLHWLMFIVALPLGLNSVTSRVSVWDFPWLLTLTNGFSPWFSTGPQPVKVAWTLSCEALFYAVTPVLFFLLARTSRKTWWSGAITIGFTVLILVLATVSPNLSWFAYLRLPEFLLGIFGFVALRGRNVGRIANALVAWGAALLFAAALILPQWVPRTFMPITTAPGALLLIVGLAHSSGGLRDLFSRSSFVLLGHASYALYLMHDPAMRYLKVFTNRTGIDTFPALNILLALLLVPGVVMASIVCFRRFETPSRLWIRNQWSRKREAIEIVPSHEVLR